MRLLLITANVGGGFMGLSMCLGTFLHQGIAGAGSAIVYVAATCIYGYILYVGLRACALPNKIYSVGPALWLQVPWVTSPLVTYRLSAGFTASFSYFPPVNSSFFFNIGSEFQLGILRSERWGLGANAAAIVLLVLLHQAAGKAKSSMPAP